MCDSCLMDALALLRSNLKNSNRTFERDSFGDIRPIEKLADSLERKFGTGAKPNGKLIIQAVGSFLTTERLHSFRDLKLICYGIAEKVGRQGSVLASPRHVHSLLAAAEGLRAESRKYRRCCQALLSA